ncbi:MAG: hypothetical protein COV67_05340 [Nitrospinae bacterium CG11_big_fil_rev_8_21_14_0_20_56_8]|nr:MAG: hypothetical protein COV67_05340 [Nitrospinae bacterium CG11_big_fil_rev_8_21_14_0_20_56_8]
MVLWVVLAAGLALAPARTGAEDKPPVDSAPQAQPQKDSLFGGQILSLTKPQEDLPPSGDPRYHDNGDGTVTDLQASLMWQKRDSYQEQKKWLNWDMAQEVIGTLNGEKFAGRADWRLPTRDELATLYDENKSITWNYYWTENIVHMDPIFGHTSCCYWSSETHKEEYAWGFNFIRGKPYLSLKGGAGLSLTVIRAVRTVLPNEKVSQAKPADAATVSSKSE